MDSDANDNVAAAKKTRRRKRKKRLKNLNRESFRVLLLANNYISEDIIPQLQFHISRLTDRSGGVFHYYEIEENTIACWVKHIQLDDITSYNFIILAPGSREFHVQSHNEVDIDISKEYLSCYRKLRKTAPDATILPLEMPPRASPKASPKTSPRASDKQHHKLISVISAECNSMMRWTVPCGALWSTMHSADPTMFQPEGVQLSSQGLFVVARAISMRMVKNWDLQFKLQYGAIEKNWLRNLEFWMKKAESANLFCQQCEEQFRKIRSCVKNTTQDYFKNLNFMEQAHKNDDTVIQLFKTEQMTRLTAFSHRIQQLIRDMLGTRCKHKTVRRRKTQTEIKMYDKMFTNQMKSRVTISHTGTNQESGKRSAVQIATNQKGGSCTVTSGVLHGLSKTDSDDSLFGLPLHLSTTQEDIEQLKCKPTITSPVEHPDAMILDSSKNIAIDQADPEQECKCSASDGEMRVDDEHSAVDAAVAVMSAAAQIQKLFKDECCALMKKELEIAINRHSSHPNLQ